MTHLNPTVLKNVVAGISDPVFDSHRAIRFILTRYPQEYAKELFALVHDTDPIQALHAEIAMCLHDVPGIRPTRKVVSMNIRGQETPNQQWEKI
jgi:hypothetical protein